MTSKLLYIFSILFFFAQLCSYGQIPVSQEPMHHNVFQNEYVRVLDVHVSPKDTTLFHKHELPSVFIVLSNVKTGSEVISEGVMANAPVTYGNIWFDGFYVKPRIHRVWNSDTMEFHVMDIELLKKSYDQIDSPLQQKSLHKLFDEKPVTGYTAVLNAKSVLELKEDNHPVLVVNLSDSTDMVTINGKLFQKKGDFIFIPAADKRAFKNGGSRAINLGIFELK